MLYLRVLTVVVMYDFTCSLCIWPKLGAQLLLSLKGLGVALAVGFLYFCLLNKRLSVKNDDLSSRVEKCVISWSHGLIVYVVGTNPKPYCNKWMSFEPSF